MSDHHSEPPNSGALPVVRNIFDVSEEFKGQMRTWLEQNPMAIPVTQILGFSQFTASIDSGQSVSVGSSGTNTAAGPSMANLPAGKYVVLAGFDGATAFSIGAATLTVSPGGMVVTGQSSNITSVAKATTLTFTVPTTISSTLSVTSGGSGTNVVQNAWMLALRYSNP